MSISGSGSSDPDPNSYQCLGYECHSYYIRWLVRIHCALLVRPIFKTGILHTRAKGKLINHLISEPWDLVVVVVVVIVTI